MNADADAIRDKLLAYGRNARGMLTPAAPEAEALVMNDKFAFLIAACLNRGTPAELIWAIPYQLKQQMGHLDPERLMRMSLEDLTQQVLALRKKPRYVNDAPRTIHGLATIVTTEFGGDAAAIRRSGSAIDVVRTLRRVHGVAHGIASMGVILIQRWFGVQFADLERADIKPDVHVQRVLGRLGLTHCPGSDEALLACRQLHPEFPGALDLPLWDIGRTYCHATNPGCNECVMEAVCPKIDGPPTQT